MNAGSGNTRHINFRLDSTGWPVYSSYPLGIPAVQLATRSLQGVVGTSGNHDKKRGTLAIFIGRFIPTIRSLVAPMLGVSGYPLLRYSLYDALACLLWALALGLILANISTPL